MLWILGHSGIRGNEIADDLVRLGAGQGNEPAVGVSYTQIKAHFHVGEENSRQEAKTIVCLVTGYGEVNYHKPNTDRMLAQTADSVGRRRKQLNISSAIARHCQT